MYGNIGTLLLWLICYQLYECVPEKCFRRGHTNVCFKYHELKLNWKNAENFCTSHYSDKGGHLASIHDENESEAIALMTRDIPYDYKCWFGLHDPKISIPNKPSYLNQWHWVFTDGTAVDYTFWSSIEGRARSQQRPFEPNWDTESSHREGCAELYIGRIDEDRQYTPKWNNNYCNVRNHCLICQFYTSGSPNENPETELDVKNKVLAATNKKVIVLAVLLGVAMVLLLGIIVQRYARKLIDRIRFGIN